MLLIDIVPIDGVSFLKVEDIKRVVEDLKKTMIIVPIGGVVELLDEPN